MSRPPTRNTKSARSSTSARPGTSASARPRTGTSSRGGGPEEGTWVVAILEARGVGRDVGIAAMDKETGRVILTQIADAATHVKTMHHVGLHSPAVILVCSTNATNHDETRPGRGQAPQPSLLVQSLEDEFGPVPIHAIQRKWFNDSAGLDYITQMIVEDTDTASVLLSVQSKYYALSATSALFKYFENNLNCVFAVHSLHIMYAGLEGTMLIDTETARNLELVTNIMQQRKGLSLFSLLNHTSTPMAERLLRSNILQPMAVQDPIEARLDAVEEILHSEDKYRAIQAALKPLAGKDLDKLIAALTRVDNSPGANVKAVETLIGQLLNLRGIVRGLDGLRVATQSCQSMQLRMISHLLTDDRIGQIEDKITERINEDANVQKTSGLPARNAKIYAVKANFSLLLDVARECYKENISDIFELASQYGEKYSLPINCVYNAGMFSLALKEDDLDGRELPSVFTNVVRKQGGKLSFTSLEMLKRNTRINDSLNEVFLLSEQIVTQLREEVLSLVGALWKASEAVAMLDLIASFAHVASVQSYIRPELTGTLALKNARHPMLEKAEPGTFIPNDSYASDAAHFQIIQGPNMSGKSVFLREIALLSVMASIGSFVPAEYASFRLHDALLSRLSNNDTIEQNMSTFAVEMASMSLILSLATQQSLVLIDEVGRGTSPHEGVGISHAIAEALIDIKAFTFFATHFRELSVSLSHLPGVVNLHLATHTNRNAHGGFGMTFEYRVLDGTATEEHYGMQHRLELAQLAGLPQDLLDKARTVSNALADKEAIGRAASASNRTAARRKVLLTLVAQLNQALDSSLLPPRELAGYLARLQKELIDNLEALAPVPQQAALEEDA